MMQSSRPQSRRLVTYGKSSRSQLQANAYKNRPAAAEQRNPNGTRNPRPYPRSTDPSENKRNRSSKSSPSSASSDTLAEQHAADIEVYDPSFSNLPPRKKRKRPDSDETPFTPEDSTIFDPPSHGDNSPTPSSRTISNIPHAPATATTGRQTATRRRLVDSLGTTERPVKESAPLNASDGASSITPSRRPSPSRDNDRNKNAHEREAYNHGSQQAVSSAAHLQNSRITYARQRSFLNEGSLSSSVETQASAAFLPEDGHSKKARPRRETVPQSNLYADNEGNEDGGSVRGIHELRQAGENARFRGAVDSIFEDIEDACASGSDPSSGFAQLCAKLSDPHMIRRFSDCGFGKRFLRCATSGLDTLSGSLALCAYELIRSAGSFSYTLLIPFLPTLLDLSSGLLSSDDDILRLTRNQRRTVSKAARSFVPRLSSVINDHPTSKISPRLLALRCIQSVLSNCQETGDTIGAIPTTLLDQLVGLLMREIPSGAENFPIPSETFQVLVLTLSILEICTAVSGPLVHESRDACQTLSRLSSILDMDANRSDNDQFQRIVTLYIRVILNVTNDDPSLCDTMSTPKLVNGLVRIVRAGFGDVSEDSEDNTLDIVILALGALTNLAEKCTSSRTIFLTTASDSDSLLDQLLGLFSASVGSVPEAHSLLEVHHNVAIGYLSILLVTLSLDREASSAIRKSLDGKGLAVTLSMVKEFLQYHDKVEQDLPSDSKGSATTGFTVRLQSIVSEIEQSGT